MSESPNDFRNIVAFKDDDAVRKALGRAADALEQAQAYAPYSEDQALAGPDMPPMKSSLDLARYCTTVHKRFGDTCVSGLSLKWGGSALNYKDEQKKRIEQLEMEATKVVQLLRDVGVETNWVDREQTDRVFAWYEFDGLRVALGEVVDV